MDHFFQWMQKIEIADSLADSIRLLPFLFLTYLLMELLEHSTGGKVKKRIRTAGTYGPLWGSLLGILPQCGFSASASSLYAGRVITVGTLFAVYLSTSDEMLPVLIAQSAGGWLIAKILVVKVAIAMISGFAAEWLYLHFFHKKEKEMDIHTICEEERCNCEDGILLSAFKHTIKIFLYLLFISVVLNSVIAGIGEEAVKSLFLDVPVLGGLIAALVGLIPNCASSVVITELYLGGVITAGAMMAGLLVNAGIGLLVLFRLNRDVRQNAAIVASLYGIGVFWGVVIEVLGITF